MYIEWKNKKDNTCRAPRKCGNCLHAVLVNPAPGNDLSKNPFSTDLGSIQERYLQSKALDVRAFHQGLFWKTVTLKLDRMDLPERDAIEAEITKRIPKPADEWSLWAVTCVPRLENL